jgi:ABC-type phosphate/phosphonate transport system substrate-binding protein
MKDLRGAVVLVATPEYAFAGCDGAWRCSFIVCRSRDPRRSLEAFRGAVAAVNGWDSDSGMNLFRATIAPFARHAPFFAALTVTGSHLASLEAVADGRVELAAIDCVTFGQMKRLYPGIVERVAIVAKSPSSPGLPFIAAAGLPDWTVDAVRNALFAAPADPGLAEPLGALSLLGARRTTPADYERVLEIEREAGGGRLLAASLAVIIACRFVESSASSPEPSARSRRGALRCSQSGADRHSRLRNAAEIARPRLVTAVR